MILSVAEKCQSSVQDPRLSDWEWNCSITNCTEKITLVAVVLVYELEAEALAADWEKKTKK